MVYYNEFYEEQLEVRDRLSRVEALLDEIKEDVNDHLHEHQWWGRLLAGTLAASAGSLVVQVISQLVK